MKMKKAVSWLLSLILVFTMIPALGSVAYAEDGGGSPSISIGAGNIVEGNKVYMGVRKIDGSIVPISWLVLGAPPDLTGLYDRANEQVLNEDSKLLIAEKVQDDVQYDSNSQFMDPSVRGVTWEGSTVRKWCREFLTGADGNDSSGWQDRFTDIEESAVLTTYKADATDYGNHQEWKRASLLEETLFLLSVEEAESSEFGQGFFMSNESRLADDMYGNIRMEWWFRSPCKRQIDAYPIYAGYVESTNGDINYQHAFESAGVRPAFNFDLRSVLFTSAAAGGKSSGDAGADALNAISDSTTNEWKLTLKDSSRSFAVSGCTETENGVFVRYTGAKTGDNEYISAIITDKPITEESAKITYYGRIKKCTAASGGVTINTADKLNDGETLYVFNEQYNGDCRTDYASELQEVSIQEPVSIEGGDVVLSKTAFTYSGKVQKPAIKTINGSALLEGTDYTAAWSNVSSKKAGSYAITITGKGLYTGTAKATYKINKAANPLAIKARTATVKGASKGKKGKLKKTKTLKVAKVIKFTKTGQGAMSYIKKSGNKKITIAKKTGKVTVRKGLKKGTHKVQVKVKAAGNANYKGSAWKIVTFRIKVK